MTGWRIGTLSPQPRVCVSCGPGVFQIPVQRLSWASNGVLVERNECRIFEPMEQITDLSSALDSCLVSESAASVLQAEFVLLLEDCKLSLGRSSPGLSSLPDKSGCYLWVVRYGAAKYCIYAGRTNSVRRRAGDYSAPFQMHSPNDFKLRFFEEQLREFQPQAKLSLFFKAVPTEHCVEEEKRFISMFMPAINRLAAPSAQDREVIQSAYRDYYRSAFGNK